MKRMLSLALAAQLMLACHQPSPITQVVCLLDATASVPIETRRKMGELLKTISTGLNRGDELIVIPITGESMADTPGSIMRFKLSLKREPYDADRRKLAQLVDEQIDNFVENTTTKPYGKTDLLGGLRLAAEEFGQGTRRRLICLSDFIQDDKVSNFLTDPMVADSAHAVSSAQRLAERSPLVFANTSIYLGLVQSTDLRKLSRPRQLGIQEFWLAYLRGQGASVQWKSDGLGRATDFLTEPIRPVRQ